VLNGAHANPTQVELALGTFDMRAATVLLYQDSAVRARLQEHDGKQVVPKLSPLFKQGQALQGGPFVVSGVSAYQLESIELDEAGKNLK